MKSEERAKLYAKATDAQRARAWAYPVLNTPGVHVISTQIVAWLSAPITLINALFWIGYAVCLFMGPVEWHAFGASPMSGTMAAKVAFVLFLHALFVSVVLAYALEVLSLVPWGTGLPLIREPDLYGTGWMGAHYIGMGGLAAMAAPSQSILVYLLIVEGLVLLYLTLAQPAFGFIPFKRGDRKLLVKMHEQGKVAGKQPVNGTTGEDDQTYSVPFTAVKSKRNFSSIHGMREVKAKLFEASQAVLADRIEGDEAPRNGILLNGDPGNGKTVFAEALAGELGIPIIEVTYGAMSSQWIGNMPKVLSNTFAYAMRCAPCVLFVDEIDSFIKSRSNASGTAEDQKITNTLLTEIVKLRDHKVVLIGATNYLASLDQAAIREGRFDFKIEVTAPDEEARVGLLNAGLAKHAKGLVVSAPDTLSVAKRWNGFSVARLNAVCKAIPEIVKREGAEQIDLSVWMMALRDVQGRRGKLPVDTRSLSELVLEGNTSSALSLIASRLSDVARIESLGGTLPTGVLFYGPSGTGKTAAARALAKQVGWAFLSVAGPDLLSDRDLLQKTFAEAKDIRPTIVFIDEADDVLRNRQYSHTPEVVNKLLTIMDGAEERVKDVVWIAATNNPDQIDPALLRSGRFTEKVLFTPPPLDMVPRHVAQWVKSRDVRLSGELDAFDIAEKLAGQTIADIEGVLQYALNAAIARTPIGSKPEIGTNEIDEGCRVVLGA